MKSGGWGLLQSELRVHGSGWGAFSKMEVDIFSTTYFIYGPFSYKFFYYFNFRYIRFVQKTYVAIHNVWCVSFHEFC